MSVYYYLFFFAVFLSLIQYVKIGPRDRTDEEAVKRKKENIYLLLVFSFATLIIGLRAQSVGIDTVRYTATFYSIKISGFSFSISEIVLKVVCWLSTLISDNPQTYLFLHAALVCFLFAIFIKYNSEDVYISTIIFIGMFFVPSMNLMRQWLAMAIGINSLTFFRRKVYLKATFIILLATLCHTTAIIYFLIPLIEIVKKKKYIIIPTIIFSFILVVFRVQIYYILSKVVTGYDLYFTSDYFRNSGAFNIKNIIFLMIVLGLGYVLVFKKSMISDEKELNTLYMYEVMMILALAFSLSGTNYMMFHRLAYYFSVILILILPSIANRLRFRGALKITIIIAMLIMLQRSGYTDNNGISEYFWFWQ